MSPSTWHWQNIVDLIEERLRPGKFYEEIQTLTAQGYAEDEAIGFFAGLVGHYLVETAGLTAALSSPPETAVQDLQELAIHLGALEFGAGAEHLPPHHQLLYSRFVGDVRPLFADLGLVMAAVLTAYVAEADDPDLDPNDLLSQADRLTNKSLKEAKSYVARAGAASLRGKRLWWGWPLEVASELQHWTMMVIGFVGSMTEDGRSAWQTASVERQRWTKKAESLQPLWTALAKGYISLSEAQFGQKSEPVKKEVEELIYKLFQGKGALSEELLAVCWQYREVIAPLLIALVQDQRLWGEQAKGEGWAPIHAVTILGKLRIEAAVEPLLQILAMTDADECLHDQILQALREIGKPALPALLDTMSYSRNRQLKLGLAQVLGVVGRGDQAAYDALLALYQGSGGTEDAGPAILGLAALHDQRVIPLLRAALRDSRLASIDKREIREALTSIKSG